MLLNSFCCRLREKESSASPVEETALHEPCSCGMMTESVGNAETFIRGSHGGEMWGQGDDGKRWKR